MDHYVPKYSDCLYDVASGITKTVGTFIRPQFCHPGLLRFFISCCLIHNMTRGVKSGNLAVDVIMTRL